MKKTKFQIILGCLATIFIVFLLNFVFLGIEFASSLMTPNSLETLNSLAKIKEVLTFFNQLAILILIMPLMDFFKYLYQKNKED